MSNPEYQAVQAAAPPSPLTPGASPSDPSAYAGVMPGGTGPAAYDIQAPMDDLTAACDAAGAVSGAGIVYPHGTRQAQTAMLLGSPEGFAAGGGTSGWDITAGFAGGGGGSWPNDIQPGILETPVQGTVDYPANTGTD